VDVRAAIRRTRLPFVASLFLAALLGAPTVAAAPAPAPVAAVRSAISTAAEPAVGEPIGVVPAATPVRTAPAVALPATPALRDQAVRVARTPRAPPLG